MKSKWLSVYVLLALVSLIIISIYPLAFFLLSSLIFGVLLTRFLTKDFEGLLYKDDKLQFGITIGLTLICFFMMPIAIAVGMPPFSAVNLFIFLAFVFNVVSDYSFKVCNGNAPSREELIQSIQSYVPGCESGQNHVSLGP